MFSFPICIIHNYVGNVHDDSDNVSNDDAGYDYGDFDDCDDGADVAGDAATFRSMVMEILIHMSLSAAFILIKETTENLRVQNVLV